MFVSRISDVDNNALTAVSLAFPVQNMQIGLATGIGVGVNALLSRGLGEKNQEQVNRSALNGLLLACFGIVLTMLFGVFCAEPFMRSQTENTVIIHYGVQYIRVITLASFGIFGEILFERLLQATGRGRQDSRQETQWLVGYSCQDMGQEQGMARVVLVEDLFEEENPCVYLAGDPVQLENMATVLRVRVKQRDLTGSQRKELEETGFYLMNEEQEELVQVNGNYRLTSIRYILLLALVCFLAYVSLKKYGR